MISVNVWFHVFLFFFNPETVRNIHVWPFTYAPLFSTCFLQIHYTFFCFPKTFTKNHQGCVFFLDISPPEKKSFEKHHSQGKTFWVSMWPLTIAPSMLQGADGTWHWTYFLNLGLNDFQVGDKFWDMSCLNDQLPKRLVTSTCGDFFREGAPQKMPEKKIMGIIKGRGYQPISVQKKRMWPY